VAKLIENVRLVQTPGGLNDRESWRDARAWQINNVQGFGNHEYESTYIVKPLVQLLLPLTFILSQLRVNSMAR
jgi:hypothetical protein